MIAPLTPRQKSAMDFIRAFVDLHGFSPSVRAIARGIGASTSSAYRLIEGLRERGAIHLVPNQHHGIRIVEAGMRVHLHPEVERSLWLFAARHRIAPETAAAEAIRAYVGAA